MTITRKITRTIAIGSIALTSLLSIGATPASADGPAPITVWTTADGVRYDYRPAFGNTHIAQSNGDLIFWGQWQYYGDGPNWGYMG